MRTITDITNPLPHHDHIFTRRQAPAHAHISTSACLFCCPITGVPSGCTRSAFMSRSSPMNSWACSSKRRTKNPINRRSRFSIRTRPKHCWWVQRTAKKKIGLLISRSQCGFPGIHGRCIVCSLCARVLRMHACTIEYEHNDVTLPISSGCFVEFQW